MTASILTLQPSAPTSSAPKKKRVLLVDASPTKRDLRADVMRTLGMEVDCACDIPEARCCWKADLYDLVLIDTERGPGDRDKFCKAIRSATPPQQVAFLVGKPEYLADSPNAEEESSAQEGDDDLAANGKVGLSSPVIADRPRNWGILEASRRISVVRSAFNARAKAIQDRPARLRDSKVRPAKRTTSATLDELLRKEMQ